MNKGLLYSAISVYIKNDTLKVLDDFPIKFTNALYNYIIENKSLPDQNQIKRILDGLKTTFFQVNRNKTKTQFIRAIVDVIPSIENFVIEKQETGVINILFLASNPNDTCPLRLGAEMRAIDQAVQSGDLRDKINIKQQWAVKLTELQGHFLRFKPNILHFSGHGSEDSEIILEDEMGNSIPVPPLALSQLFNIFKDQIKIVVLNACYSKEQAKSIVKHIPNVIGMADTISDETAITFSSAFYQALAYGMDVKTAFSLALNQINLLGIPESDIPILYTK